MNRNQVILVLGSNIAPEENIRKAIIALDEYFNVLKVSGVYETPPFGMDGDSFINAAVLIETQLSIKELKWKYLRPIELRLGRKRSTNKYSPRSIDIDIVVHHDTIVDKEIFVLPHLAVPISDISPSLEEPDSNLTIKQLVDSRLDKTQIKHRPDLIVLEN